MAAQQQQQQQPAQQASRPAAVADELASLYAGTDIEAAQLRQRRRDAREKRIRRVEATLDAIARCPELAPTTGDDGVAWDAGEAAAAARLDWGVLAGADAAFDPQQQATGDGERKRQHFGL